MADISVHDWVTVLDSASADAGLAEGMVYLLTTQLLPVVVIDIMEPDVHVSLIVPSVSLEITYDS
jgi:hypothetical protein